MQALRKFVLLDDEMKKKNYLLLIILHGHNGHGHKIKLAFAGLFLAGGWLSN